MQFVGRGDRADLRSHSALQFDCQVGAGIETVLEQYEGVDALALDLVRVTDDGGFGAAGMADQRALDLGRAESVAANVEYVVDAAGQPVVAVLIAV